MARKDKFEANLQRSGWKRGAHREQDKERVVQSYGEKAKKGHELLLSRFTKFSREDPLESLESVRARCLAPNVAAPELEILKDFFRYNARGSSGRLDTGRLDRQPRITMDSALTHAEWFFAGFKRVTGRTIEEEDKREIYKWTREQLAYRDEELARKWQPKYNFSKDDLDRVLMTLWSQDDTIFIPERHRVQTALLFHIYCFTGARIGAFFPDKRKKGLRWQDLALVLQRTRGSEWRLIYRIDQRWVKNNRDHDNVAFGTAGKQHAKLIYDDASLLLALAIADGVLKQIDSVEDLFKQRVVGRTELPLRYKKGMELEPVVKAFTRADGVKSAPMTESTFVRIFKNCCERAGYFKTPTVHAIRRSLGKKIDVDGAAAFLDEPADHGPVDYFQSFRQFHEHGLPDSLPLRRLEKLFLHPDILA